jgi:hypothetical protein
MAQALTIDDTADATSKVAKTRERRGAGRPRPCLPRSVPRLHGDRSRAEREANAKWLRGQAPRTETKRHVRPYTQSITDQPFLNRVSKIRRPVRSETIDVSVSRPVTPQRWNDASTERRGGGATRGGRVGRPPGRCPPLGVGVPPRRSSAVIRARLL